MLTKTMAAMILIKGKFIAKFKFCKTVDKVGQNVNAFVEGVEYGVKY